MRRNRRPINPWRSAIIWAQMFDVDLVVKCFVDAGGLDANSIPAQEFQDSERFDQGSTNRGPNFSKELAA